MVSTHFALPSPKSPLLCHSDAGERGRLACARLSDSVRSGNLLKVKFRPARLGKGGGGGGKNVSPQPPRVFRISYY